MTQKEQVLQELTRASRGLTTVELQELTGIHEASLRTIMWEMRRDGWVEPVGGVRGRYRYDVTTIGRQQAPQPYDAIQERISSELGVLMGGRLSNRPASQTASEAAQQLLQEFVRWLSRERPGLFDGDASELEGLLEEAVLDYVLGDVDVLRSLFDRVGPNEG